MKAILRATAFALCLMTALLCVVPALADFGDFDTGGDYGGWDSDWGSDWGSDSSWGGSSSGGGSSSPLAMAFMLVMILFMPIIRLIERVVDAVRRFVRETRYRLTMKDMWALKRYDPDFDWEAINAWVRDLYTRMQAEWEKGDITSLQGEFTRACWDRFDNQLRNKNSTGIQGHVRDIQFWPTAMPGWCRMDGVAYMDIVLRTRIISWNTNRDGQTVTGSKTLPKFMNYLWRVQRPADKRTDPEPRPCPACGKANRRVLAHCPDCGAALERDPEEWVLYDISGVPEYIK